MPGELLGKLDALIEDGVFESRAATVRAGVEAITTLDCNRIDQAIIEGDRPSPPTKAEQDDALTSLRDAITEEAW